MTYQFHFMPYEIHFMTEPTLGCSFEVMATVEIYERVGELRAKNCRGFYPEFGLEPFLLELGIVRNDSSSRSFQNALERTVGFAIGNLLDVDDEGLFGRREL